jgi:hypothetical protein
VSKLENLPARGKKLKNRRLRLRRYPFRVVPNSGNQPVPKREILHLVSQSAHGIVRLLADGSFQLGVQPGSLLGATLASFEALTDTCYANLRAGPPTRSGSRLQGKAFTEYLDRRHLRAYVEFLDESAQAFLAMHETWLKRHEVKRVDPRRICPVGVGVFAIRGSNRSLTRVEYGRFPAWFLM